MKEGVLQMFVFLDHVISLAIFQFSRFIQEQMLDLTADLQISISDCKSLQNCPTTSHPRFRLDYTCNCNIDKILTLSIPVGRQETSCGACKILKFVFDNSFVYSVTYQNYDRRSDGYIITNSPKDSYVWIVLDLDP